MQTTDFSGQMLGQVDVYQIHRYLTAPRESQATVYVPEETHRNPSREAKHQCHLLKDYFNHVGALA